MDSLDEDSIYPIQTGKAKASSFPVAVRFHPSRGRYVVTTRRVAAGELLLESEPYATAVYSKLLDRVCAVCFREASPRVLQCGECESVYYCGDRCHRYDAARHAAECSDFKKYQALNTESIESAMPRMLLRVAQQRPEGDVEPAPYASRSTNPTFEEVLSLVSHANRQDAGTFIEVQAMSLAISERVLGPSGGLDAARLTQLFFAGQCNAHSIAGQDIVATNLGIGFFPLASMINHSCLPNCHHYFQTSDVGHPPKLVFRASVDIPEGAEVAYSYVTAYQGVEARQNTLRRVYFFQCDCDRCQVEAGVAEGGEQLPGANGASVEATTPSDLAEETDGLDAAIARPRLLEPILEKPERYTVLSAAHPDLDPAPRPEELVRVAGRLVAEIAAAANFAYATHAETLALEARAEEPADADEKEEARREALCKTEAIFRSYANACDQLLRAAFMLHPRHAAMFKAYAQLLRPAQLLYQRLDALSKKPQSLAPVLDEGKVVDARVAAFFQPGNLAGHIALVAQDRVRFAAYALACMGGTLRGAHPEQAEVHKNLALAIADLMLQDGPAADEADAPATPRVEASEVSLQPSTSPSGADAGEAAPERPAAVPDAATARSPEVSAARARRRLEFASLARYLQCEWLDEDGLVALRSRAEDAAQAYAEILTLCFGSGDSRTAHLRTFATTFRRHLGRVPGTASGGGGGGGKKKKNKTKKGKKGRR